jgi:hypothetical protein
MASPVALKIKNSEPILKFLTALSNAVNNKIKYEDAYLYIDDY